MATVAPPQTKTEPRVEIVTVTPADAEKWLMVNHDHNRRMRPMKVAEYVADMKAGRWILSDQAISFNTLGNLINGQHRLAAVHRSGVSIRSLILWNCPDRSLFVIDGAMKRSTDDRFGMAGKSYPNGCGATVRRLLIGMSTDTKGKASISDWRVDEFMSDHGASIAFVHTATAKFKITLASIRAVLARAKIRKVPGERLERFCEVLGTGLMGAGENAAVLLRNYIASFKQMSSGSGSMRQRLYALTESALTTFLANERITKLTPAKEELFPVAGDRVK